MDFLFEYGLLINGGVPGIISNSMIQHQIPAATPIDVNRRSIRILRQTVNAWNVELVFDWFQNRKTKMIYPFDPRTIKTLFMMYEGGIDAWLDGEPVRLEKNCWNFFMVNSIAHKAKVPMGDHSFAHIIYSDEIIDYFKSASPVFKLLMDEVEEKGVGVLSRRKMRITPFAHGIIRRLLQCRHVGEAAEVYFHRLSIHLLSCFVAQLEIEFRQETVMMKELAVYPLVEEVENLLAIAPREVTLEKIAHAIGMEVSEVDNYYFNYCYISATDLVEYFRMERAFDLVIRAEDLTEERLSVIANKSGYVLAEFKGVFRRYWRVWVDELYEMKAGK